MSELIKYNLLDSGIHQFVWMDSSVDALMQYRQLFLGVLSSQLQKTEDKVTVMTISDYRYSTFPDLKDVVSETVDSRRLGLVQFDRIVCRIAHLSDDEDIQDKVNAVSRIMPSTFQREFFKVDEEDQAIAWLLSE